MDIVAPKKKNSGSTNYKMLVLYKIRKDGLVGFFKDLDWNLKRWLGSKWQRKWTLHCQRTVNLKLQKCYSLEEFCMGCDRISNSGLGSKWWCKDGHNIAKKTVAHSLDEAISNVLLAEGLYVYASSTKSHQKMTTTVERMFHNGCQKLQTME